MLDEAALARLSDHLADQLGCKTVHLAHPALLSGGTLQENWRLEMSCEGGAYTGKSDVVLRVTHGDAIPGSLTRVQEYAVWKAVHEAGVTVPEPVVACEDRAIIGADFMISRLVAGTASPAKLARAPDVGGDKEALARQLGVELARMHRLRPDTADLTFLRSPQGSNASSLVRILREELAEIRTLRPALEYGLRWLDQNAPPSTEQVLTHGDFRTGNFMADGDGLTGILDWELAAWGDAYMDMGWLCARFWRYGQDEKEAGGIGSRAAFNAGYTAESGNPVDRKKARYWEILACARWAVISLQQLHRHLSGTSPSLELALTGKCTAEAEYEMLRLIRQSTNWEVVHA